MFEFIPALIGVMKIWTDYDLKKREAEQKQQAVPEKPADADKGKQVFDLVKQSVVDHGNKSDQRVLEGFEEEPEEYAEMLTNKVTELVKNNKSFAQQLEDLAKQIDIASSSDAKGSVNISGHANVEGIVSGISHGNITYTPK